MTLPEVMPSGGRGSLRVTHYVHWQNRPTRAIICVFVGKIKVKVSYTNPRNAKSINSWVNILHHAYPANQGWTWYLRKKLRGSYRSLGICFCGKVMDIMKVRL